MHMKLNVFVAALAVTLPGAATAQMSGPASTPEAQAPQSSTGLTRTANEPAATAGEVKPATAADIKTGAEIFDPKGGVVGKVETVAADGVVVSTGTVKAKIPASSLGKGDKGLVIAMTKAEFEAAAKKAPSS